MCTINHLQESKTWEPYTEHILNFAIVKTPTQHNYNTTSITEQNQQPLRASVTAIRGTTTTLFTTKIFKTSLTTTTLKTTTTTMSTSTATK